MTADPKQSRQYTEGLVRRSAEFPDGEQSFLASPGGPDAPRVVFSHATGFNANAYRRLLAPLMGRAHILAPDQRGHGRSTLKADPRKLLSFDRYADDLVRLLEREGFAPALLAGHSLGATVSVLAAAKRPDLATGVVLFEPVLTPAMLRWLAYSPAWIWMREGIPIRRNAIRRRSRWANRSEVKASYEDKPFFASWAEGVLDDYLDGGLVEDEDGVRLACDPQWEGATFAAMGHDLWRAVRRLKAPSALVRAGKGSTAPAPLVQRYQRLQPEAKSLFFEDAGHLLPLERPDACCAILSEMLFGAPAEPA
ncbi:MAG: alpha/beta hydrolase [Pseudomonadota bacterium]